MTCMLVPLLYILTGFWQLQCSTQFYTVYCCLDQVCLLAVDISSWHLFLVRWWMTCRWVTEGMYCVYLCCGVDHVVYVYESSGILCTSVTCVCMLRLPRQRAIVTSVAWSCMLPSKSAEIMREKLQGESAPVTLRGILKEQSTEHHRNRWPKYKPVTKLLSLLPYAPILIMMLTLVKRHKASQLLTWTLSSIQKSRHVPSILWCLETQQTECALCWTF